MRVRITLVLLFCFSVAMPVAAQTPGGPDVSYGLNLGYYGGPGAQGNITISGFARDLPLDARFGMGYASVEPGSAADARRIFINQATNGIPEEHGRVWDFRLDLLYPLKLSSLRRAYIFGGPRYSRFTGNFKYIGGNEDFDVTSRQWGVGVGLESYFAMGAKLDLVLSGGYDYLPASTLSGHDTSYSPDDDNVNPREDFTFEDAEEAINQPKHEIRLMVGFQYSY